MSDELEKIKDKLRVAILSGSTGDDPEELSRSRALAEAYRDYLTSHGAEVDWMDMRDMGDMPDTYDWDTDWYDDYKKRLTDADAMVVSTPIFNYGPSGKVLQFLHRTLDKENQQFKPYSLLSGAGSPRSALALGGLANQLDTEIKGIGIGGGVQVAGDEFDVETGEMDPGIISRANENAAKLLQVAEAMRSKTSSSHGSSRDLHLDLLKLAEKSKPKGTATKRDPAKWEAAKRKAKAKMGGKHSARAMQLATKYYKEDGGGYKGKKPTAKNNKLKKWTKQDWQWSGERKKKSSVNQELVDSLLDFSKESKERGKGVYLPAKSIDALKSTKKGRSKLRSASRKKTEATRKGQQHASHGLHKGKNRSKLANRINILREAGEAAGHFLGEASGRATRRVNKATLLRQARANARRGGRVTSRRGVRSPRPAAAQPPITPPATTSPTPLPSPYKAPKEVIKDQVKARVRDKATGTAMNTASDVAATVTDQVPEAVRLGTQGLLTSAIGEGTARAAGNAAGDIAEGVYSLAPSSLLGGIAQREALGGLQRAGGYRALGRIPALGAPFRSAEEAINLVKTLEREGGVATNNQQFIQVLRETGDPNKAFAAHMAANPVLAQLQHDSIMAGGILSTPTNFGLSAAGLGALRPSFAANTSYIGGSEGLSRLSTMGQRRTALINHAAGPEAVPNQILAGTGYTTGRGVSARGLSAQRPSEAYIETPLGSYPSYLANKATPEELETVVRATSRGRMHPQDMTALLADTNQISREAADAATNILDSPQFANSRGIIRDSPRRSLLRGRYMSGEQEYINQVDKQLSQLNRAQAERQYQLAEAARFDSPVPAPKISDMALRNRALGGLRGAVKTSSVNRALDLVNNILSESHSAPGIHSAYQMGKKLAALKYREGLIG